MKKFNLGIVGYGWAATAHIPAINASPLGRVTRICSSRALDVRELSARHGCALQAGTDYAELLADPAINDACYESARSGKTFAINPAPPLTSEPT
jgi:predicted dehydrogenase